MFERFTDRARRVIVLAQEEARMLNHNYIGTEHILLGLIHEGRGAAGTALDSLGVTLEGAREQVLAIVGRGQEPPSGHIPFTPRAKKVLELSLREALDLGHTYIGPGDILLGLIREGDGVANVALVNLGTSGEQVRQTVLELMEAGGEESGAGREFGEPVLEPAGPQAVGTPLQLESILRQLTAINGRLARIEERLGVPAHRSRSVSSAQSEAASARPEPVEDPAPPEAGPSDEAGPQAG